MNMTSIMYEVISTVAFGGNVLINVGPTHDGRIVPIFQVRNTPVLEPFVY